MKNDLTLFDLLFLIITTGFFFDEKSYMANTFDMEEIFSLETIARSKMEKPFLEIREIKSLVLGRCFIVTMYAYNCKTSQVKFD